MREVTYYRLVATLPVVIPFIAHLFYRDDPTISLMDRVTTLLYVSGIAWPAYIPFAAVLFWWLAGQPVGRYRRVSWITPILFLPPFLAYLLLVRWWTASSGAVGRCPRLLCRRGPAVRLWLCAADACGAARAGLAGAPGPLAA